MNHYQEIISLLIVLGKGKFFLIVIYKQVFVKYVVKQWKENTLPSQAGNQAYLFAHNCGVFWDMSF